MPAPLRRPFLAVVLLALCTLWLPGCNDSGTGPVGGYRIVVTGSFTSVSFAPNLYRFQLLLDDSALLQEVYATTPFVGVTLDGRLDYVSRGPHSLRFLVAAQQTTPYRYQALDVYISLYDPYGVLVNRIAVPFNSQNLSTGQAMIYDFYL